MPKQVMSKKENAGKKAPNKQAKPLSRAATGTFTKGPRGTGA